MMRLFGCSCLVALLAGCATTRIVTIQTRPDADISVDGLAAGPGTVTQKLTWKNSKDVHHVTATRLGYKDTSADLPRDFARDTLLLELPQQSRLVTLAIEPAPALVSIDGQPVSDRPVDRLTQELPFTVDKDGKWTTHTITATRPGFEPAKTTFKWDDASQIYTLTLEPMKKNLSIKTQPSGAKIYIDGKLAGESPLRLKAIPFAMDLKTNQWIPKKVDVAKPGYPPIAQTISWDNGKTDYTIDLTAKSKAVHIVTDPPNATVTLADGRTLEHDASGAAIGTLSFPPIDDKGTLRTYELTIEKKTQASEWYPVKLNIAWDEGKSDYSVRLKEILTRPVTMVIPDPQRGDGGWRLVPRQETTLAMKDVTEGPSHVSPSRLVSAADGETIGSLSVSPDGSTLLYSVILSDAKEDFRSQLRSSGTSGSGGESQLTDGKSLELMPTYSPDGGQIIFSSNRAGRMSIWSMSATGLPGMTQLTLGDTTDLWPSIDAGPKARLYYERLADTRPDARLYMTRVGTTIRTDLTSLGGMQPRVSPKGNEILFTHQNPRTGKRDIYRMSDSGGSAENLTNTPDVDEADPVWNRDGTKIAFASDRGMTADKHHNFDIWVLDLTRPEQPAQITTNGSWDDSPAWDPAGKALYFRSNRGGQWGIWRIGIKN
jgi:hypothetical protein